MKNQKSIGEYLSKKERKEVQKRIDAAQSPELQRLMLMLLEMTFEELCSLKEKLEDLIRQETAREENT